MLRITSLKCDYRSDGLYIETSKPSFSWILESDGENITQKSYRIAVRNADKVIWDSGILQSDKSIHVQYEGDRLSPLTRYSYDVTVTVSNGETACAEGSFETGRLGMPFDAKFIYSGNVNKSDCTEPVHIFRKTFTLRDRKVIHAVMFASAIGIFEADIDGIPVSDEFFAPGNTNAFSHIQYMEYDVTSLIKKNFTVQACVANGWQLGRVDNKTNYYSDKRGFICEIHVFYDDGTKDVLITDDTWEWSDESPVRFADFYDGETYDANISPVNFKKCVLLPKDDCKKLIPRLGVPVKHHETLNVCNILKDPDGCNIYDFGQNFAGVVRIRTNAPKGTVITVTHAELIHGGVFFTENLCTAKATLKYICKGGGEEFMPRFTYMGFRYAKVHVSQPCDIELFGEVLYSDVEILSTFNSSNAKINRLHRNIIWSGKGNFVDIPTDCPQRDERLGWTGDIAVFASTAAFNMDISLFMRKWLYDLESEQKDGVVPFTIPDVNIFDKPQKTPTAGWSDAACMVPWAVYMSTGDSDILARQYESMKAWVNCEKSCCNDNLIWEDGFQFGD
ncbi:MAG: family 78 glycoside hydrolase catalytic domain [Clostridia bacterium]|nr:family 78 glycoside hydrolase catalytic domain [Clostridia bacterium]